MLHGDAELLILVKLGGANIGRRQGSGTPDAPTDDAPGAAPEDLSPVSKQT